MGRARAGRRCRAERPAAVAGALPLSRVAVVGLGLIGGSLALATRARGYDRSPDVAERARRRGVDAAGSLAEAVAGAEIVVAAVPTAATPALLGVLASLAPAALLTDTASVKTPIVAAAGTLPAGTRFAAGHPMAGSRRDGVEGADPAIFAGRPWAVVPTPCSDPAAIEAVIELARSVGARPVVLEAGAHDRAMTWVSHLPHAVAVSLVRAAAAGAPERLADLAGPGFLDSTRIAGRRIELELELALADPEALAGAIDAVRGELDSLASALREGDRDAVSRLFQEAVASRRAVESGKG